MTLELALAGVPMVAAYRVSAIEEVIARRLIQVPSVILANLVLGENVVPELLQEDCTPERLADALVPLLGDTPERRRQLEAFARLDAIMEIGAAPPSERAADIVLATVERAACSGTLCPFGLADYALGEVRDSPLPAAGRGNRALRSGGACITRRWAIGT